MDFYRIPMGFGTALTRNFDAMNAYTALSDEEKQALLARVHAARSEEEMVRLAESLAR